MKGVLGFIAVLASIIIGSWFIFNFFFLTDEDKIYRLVESTRRDFERGSILSLMTVFAEDYQDQRGWGRADVLQILRMVIDGTDERNVRITAVEIQRAGEDADADVKVLFNAEFNSNAGFQRENLRNYMSRPLDVTMEFTKKNRRWKIKAVNISGER